MCNISRCAFKKNRLIISYRIAQEIYCFESRCGRIYRNPKQTLQSNLQTFKCQVYCLNELVLQNKEIIFSLRAYFIYRFYLQIL